MAHVMTRQIRDDCRGGLFRRGTIFLFFVRRICRAWPCLRCRYNFVRYLLNIIEKLAFSLQYPASFHLGSSLHKTALNILGLRQSLIPTFAMAWPGTSTGLQS